MSRYIDAEKFVVELRERFCEDCDDELACWACGIHKTIEAIEDYPAADVAPVVHGHWIDKTEWHGNIGFCCYECSNCGYVRDNKPKSRGDGRGCNFCDDCGAKMDESEGEE